LEKEQAKGKDEGSEEKKWESEDEEDEEGE
jgi:hypothetical protein